MSKKYRNLVSFIGWLILVNQSQLMLCIQDIDMNESSNGDYDNMTIDYNDLFGDDDDLVRVMEKMEIYKLNVDDKSNFTDSDIFRTALLRVSLATAGEPITRRSNNVGYTGRIIDGKEKQDPEVDTTVTNRVAWFLGIPYAKPPVGDLRFKSPEPLDTSTLNDGEYTSFGKSCIQGNYWSYTSNKSEDCLFLNIYSPVEENSEDKTYPVMVYIHGGSYINGDGSLYTGSILAQQGIVLVTINYRVATFGFIHGHGESKGNYGLEDQVMALQWVQENIGVFGGDPDKVTVFGSSAGASSIGLLNVSPLTKGLFRTVILQSGTPNFEWTVDRYNSNETFDELMSSLNCPTIDRHLKCTRAESEESIINAEIGLKDYITNNYFKPNTGSGAIMPNYTNSSQDKWDNDDQSTDGLFLAERWLIQSNHSTASTIVSGFVDEEFSNMMGWFISNTPIIRKDYKNGLSREDLITVLKSALTHTFGFHESAVQKTLDAYFIEREHRSYFKDRRNNYIELFSDIMIKLPTMKFLESMMAINNRKQTQGNTDLTKMFAYSLKLRPEENHTHHGMELDYIFGGPFLNVEMTQGSIYEYGAGDRQLSSRIMTLWANIAKYENPSQFSKWKEMKGSSFSGDYLRVNSTGILQPSSGNFRTMRKMALLQELYNDKLVLKGYSKTLKNISKQEDEFTRDSPRYRLTTNSINVPGNVTRNMTKIRENQSKKASVQGYYHVIFWSAFGLAIFAVFIGYNCIEIEIKDYLN